MGLLDKVKQTAGKVGDQAKGLADSGRDKVEDLKLKRRLEHLQGEIGALVVSQRRGAAPADADARIDALVAEITEAETEAAAEAAEAEARAVEQAVAADTGPDDADAAEPHSS